MISNKNLCVLIDAQKELDERIIKEFKIDPKSEDIFYKRLVAFFVELSEFINEERSFKFWSKKAGNDHAKVVEEYIDGLHFILSIGINIGYDFENHANFEEGDTLYKVYLNTITHLAEFYKNKSVWDFRKMLSSFLKISEVLKIEEAEIIKVYNEKNKKNHTRQDEGY